MIPSVAPSLPLVWEGVLRIWINSKAPPLPVPVVKEGLNYFSLAGDLSHHVRFPASLSYWYDWGRRKCNRNLNKDAGIIYGCFYNSLFSISSQLFTQCTIQSWKSYISRLLRISYIWLKVPSRSNVPTRKCRIYYFCIGNSTCYPASFWL